MARVTVEDCVTKIPNRFELVMLAAQRARDIAAGAQATVDDDSDKNPVIALREIADETVSPEELSEALVRGLQRYVEIEDEPDDEPLQLPAANDDAEGAAAGDSGAAADASDAAPDSDSPQAGAAEGGGAAEAAVETGGAG